MDVEDRLAQELLQLQRLVRGGQGGDGGQLLAPLDRMQLWGRLEPLLAQAANRQLSLSPQRRQRRQLNDIGGCGSPCWPWSSLTPPSAPVPSSWTSTPMASPWLGSRGRLAGEAVGRGGPPPAVREQAPACQLSNTLSLVHRVVAPNATLAYAMDLDWQQTLGPRA